MNAATFPKIDDATLVMQLKARDHDALDDLLRIHGGRLFGVALQFMRNEIDAREVMQDALIQIWNKIESFEHRSALTTWMHRITVNAALMKMRREKKFQQNVPLENDGPDHDLPVIQLADTGCTPHETACNTELGARVRAAIDALPEPYRSAVLLSDVDGLSMQEIAEATGATIAAVKTRIHRGRLALRKALAPYLCEAIV